MTENYQPTVMLRNNPGMIRDCWLEKSADSKDQVLCIRQIKFDDSLQVERSKIIRLVGQEIVALYNLLDNSMDLIDTA